MGKEKNIYSFEGGGGTDMTASSTPDFRSILASTHSQQEYLHWESMSAYKREHASAGGGEGGDCRTENGGRCVAGDDEKRK